MKLVLKFYEDRKYPFMRVESITPEHGDKLKLQNWGVAMSKYFDQVCKLHKSVTDKAITASRLNKSAPVSTLISLFLNSFNYFESEKVKELEEENKKLKLRLAKYEFNSGS